MKRWFLILTCGLLVAAADVGTPTLHWREAQAQRLVDWLEDARQDGLEKLTREVPALQSAIATHDPDTIDSVATDAALRLLEAHRVGCCGASLREGWHIEQNAVTPDPLAALRLALEQNRVDSLFVAARPEHPFYLALRKAYGTEKDPVRRATLAANLDRWRWMPREQGVRYLLVNTASFEATLWDRGHQAGRWQVIVGKTRSPTPIFAAKVTGVIFNPWWEIPSSIVEESVGALLRNQPAEAARKGYVTDGTRYRQKPGPDNALGRMKLIMPNPYNIYLHDTPSQSLFGRDVRAFSHGCVRVGDALGLATALLAPLPDWDRDRVEAEVATGKTAMIALAPPIPVYVAYFTAESDGQGGVRYLPDIYKRDRAATASGGDGAQCGR
ncbi:MAG: L,D-transpeptidase family protein [Sphingomonas sp.]|nr:L,D-transpeptidase family protein [Sphingomonas sp.]